jgi:hypothetical protein
MPSDNARRYAKTQIERLVCSYREKWPLMPERIELALAEAHDAGARDNQRMMAASGDGFDFVREAGDV